MLVDLLRAGHAGPSAVVTLVVAGLGAAADVPAGRLAVLLVAVAAGQLAIGWCNDLVDVDRDRAGGRADKPLVEERHLSPRTVVAAVGGALVVATAASLAVGIVPGLLHLAGVAAGLAYDLWLKSTIASAAPYAVAFGLVPAFTVAALPEPARATWWAMVAGACFGVGVHLANAVPDLQADAATDVRGLPQRLGRTPALVGSVVVLVVGCATVLAGSGDGWTWLAVRAGVLGVIVVGVVVAARRRADEVAERLAMLLGLATVALLVASGSAIVA